MGQRIVDPEVKRPEPYGRLLGRMARRRKCRHTAAKGAAEDAAATFLRFRSCHHVTVMSNFAVKPKPVAAAAPCHCMAVTGGASGCGRIFVGSDCIAAGNWLF